MNIAFLVTYITGVFFCFYAGILKAERKANYSVVWSVKV